MLLVTGRLSVAASDLAAFAADLRTLADAARGSDGCSFFAVGEETAARGEMLVCERWRDVAALRSFLLSAAFQEFGRRWRERMKNDLRMFRAEELAGLEG